MSFNGKNILQHLKYSYKTNNYGFEKQYQLLHYLMVKKNKTKQSDTPAIKATYETYIMEFTL